MQTGSGEILFLLGVLESDRELELHQKFRKFRIHGEWFESSADLLIWIKENALLSDSRPALLGPAVPLRQTTAIDLSDPHVWCDSVYDLAEARLRGDNGSFSLWLQKMLSDLIDRHHPELVCYAFDEEEEDGNPTICDCSCCVIGVLSDEIFNSKIVRAVGVRMLEQEVFLSTDCELHQCFNFNGTSRLKQNLFARMIRCMEDSLDWLDFNCYLVGPGSTEPTPLKEYVSMWKRHKSVEDHWISQAARSFTSLFRAKVSSTDPPRAA